jgi:hypothetical protein
MNPDAPQSATPTAFEVWTKQANERYDALVAELPKTMPIRQYVQFCRYAFTVSRLGNKQRTRVMYPWRPQTAELTPETRVKRGNPDRNPTALQ